MTTIAQLRKVAKDSFIDAMINRGFEESKKSKLFFYRVGNDDIYQIVDFEILRGGENLRIGVYCWVPEVQGGYDMASFPKHLAITNGCYLLKNSIGRGSRFWDLRDEEKRGNCLDEILSELDRIALPWFADITSRSDLVEAMFLDLKESEYFEEDKQAILGV